MGGRGIVAPAAFAWAIGMGLLGAASVAPAQPVLQQPPASVMPVPGELELSKLIWSTMTAVDHANQAGNYSVLRDLSAPGFQINNDAAKLAEIFASIRASGVDLSNTLLLAPSYTAAPAIVSENVLRVQGFFGLRPTAIDFDLYYQWVQGKWRLFGVSLRPRQIPNQQQAAPAPRR